MTWMNLKWAEKFDGRTLKKINESGPWGQYYKTSFDIIYVQIWSSSPYFLGGLLQIFT